MEHVSRETPPAPSQARGVFGDRLTIAESYAGLLADEASVRGLIGPREVPRLWERHLLNCAVLSDLIRAGEHVADIGSGAGLPGLVLAIRRPDVQVTLVEPLLRRTTFLEEASDRLVLDNVEVVRARAEELARTRAGEFDAVTARAVAPLAKLARWALPLTRAGGRVLAMKGLSAQEELDRDGSQLSRHGGAHARVVVVGSDIVDEPVRVIAVDKRRAS